MYMYLLQSEMRNEHYPRKIQSNRDLNPQSPAPLNHNAH